MNGRIASVLVNLGIKKPDCERPFLLRIRVRMLAPRPDGLSNSEESHVLWKIEDDLAAELSQPPLKADLVGRITTDGRREWYFYTERPTATERHVFEIMKKFPEFRFDWETQEDPNWNHYFSSLYPSREERQTLENAKVLEALVEHGDSLEEPRDVSHWTYFAADSDRDQFLRQLIELGFSVISFSESQGERLPFGVCFSRRDHVDAESIDRVTLQLFWLAKCHRGEYDGWETKVIKPTNESETP